ncbi:MAG: putative DNA binding domain-containing protein [Bacteroidales bacterium]|jgi:ATP-dependent DNA helicase RecG|nr:putative DNA binding domain-containing protein [Bacteroidales bacterium]
MLTGEDIKLIISGGEAFNAEFKVAVPVKIRELTEEVCAFANSAGGFLLIGVDDKNQIQGVEINNAKRSAIQNSIREISPALYTELYPVNVDDKTVWVIEVPTGENQPYVFMGAIHIREGANTQKLTAREEIQAFFQQCDRIHFDEVLCPDFDIHKDIEEENFDEFCHLARISPETPREQIFKNLNLINRDGIVKNAGVLFFGKKPEYYHLQAVIHCVCFKGTERYLIIDNKVYGGPVYQQYLKALDWLQNKISVRFIIEGGGPRKEVWEIPIEVFKEAILNAISHRDYYEKGGEILISVFDDRVEIANPGGLLPAVAKSFGSLSLSRNPAIFGLFTRMHIVEHVGSGIRRMKEAMQKANLPPPEYETVESCIFTVRRDMNFVGDKRETINDILNNELTPELTPAVAPEVTPEVKQLLSIIKGEMTKAELMNLLNLKDDKHFRMRYLQLALKGGFIEMTIPNKPNSRLQKYRLTAKGYTPAVAPEVTPEVTPEVKQLLSILQGEMTKAELMNLLNLKDDKHFRMRYLQLALKGGFIEMTIPNKPNSNLQKYRLTGQGICIKDKLENI